MVKTLIDQLAALAKQNAETEGWSLTEALKRHEIELEENPSAKNMADVLWLQAATGYPYEIPSMNEDIAQQVTGRLQQLKQRLETTGSLRSNPG